MSESEVNIVEDLKVEWRELRKAFLVANPECHDCKTRHVTTKASMIDMKRKVSLCRACFNDSKTQSSLKIKTKNKNIIDITSVAGARQYIAKLDHEIEDIELRLLDECDPSNDQHWRRRATAALSILKRDRGRLQYFIHQETSKYAGYDAIEATIRDLMNSRGIDVTSYRIKVESGSLENPRGSLTIVARLEDDLNVQDRLNQFLVNTE